MTAPLQTLQSLVDELGKCASSLEDNRSTDLWGAQISGLRRELPRLAREMREALAEIKSGVAV